jgi:imidazolonepropionase-like amidohydrolase
LGEDLVVHDGRVTGGSPCRDALVIERGLYVLPGFVDAHAHLTLPAFVRPGDFEEAAARDPDSMRRTIERRLRCNVANGVLAVRDAGSPAVYPRSIHGMVDRKARSSSMPNLITCGRFIAQRGRYPRSGSRESTSLGLIRAAAAEAAGSEWVKLVGDGPRRSQPNEQPGSSWTAEAVGRAVEAAHAQGAQVAMHAMTFAAADAAVRAGVETIEHGWMLTREHIATMATAGAGWTPTVLALELSVGLSREHSAASRRFYDEAAANTRELLRDERAASILLCGTDLSTAHGAVAREAIKLVEWGVDPEMALRALTVNGWRILGFPEPLTEGSAGDFVLLDHDPREGMDGLVRPAVVVRAGRLVPTH